MKKLSDIQGVTYVLSDRDFYKVSNNYELNEKFLFFLMRDNMGGSEGIHKVDGR